MSMGKPIVEYTELLGSAEAGKSACIYGVHGHPRWTDGTGLAKLLHTSTVVAVGKDGEFETLNTFYRPAKVDA